MVDRGKEGVRGEENRLEVKKKKRLGSGGEERGIGNHRYVLDGGWVAWREDIEKVPLWRSEGTVSYEGGGGGVLKRKEKLLHMSVAPCLSSS